MWQAQGVSVAEDPQTELEAALARESELRAALVEAHRRRLESEDELTARLDAAVADAEALRRRLAEVEERALAERVRRERLERIPPVRVLKRLAGLPLLAALRARRARAYEATLARVRGEDG